MEKSIEKKSTNYSVFQELLNRFKNPWHKKSFVLYFILVIVLLSGLGWIFQLFFHFHEENLWQNVIENMMTYSISLLAPAFISILLKYFHESNYKVSLIIITVFLLVTEGFIISFSYDGISIGSIICVGISVLVALFLWVVANSDNALLDDEAYDENIYKKVNEHGKNWN